MDVVGILAHILGGLLIPEGFWKWTFLDEAAVITAAFTTASEERGICTQEYKKRNQKLRKRPSFMGLWIFLDKFEILYLFSIMSWSEEQR